jgi:hypothetical protein
LDFYTGSTNRMSITNGGNVGIGTSAPGFLLSFAPVLGDKISLWSNSSNSYGFGIQSSLLQIHTAVAGDDIAFGYGSSASLTENMRIKGNGNVGIGTANPAAKLHVSAGDASFALFGPNSYGGQLYIGASPNNQSAALTAQVIASDGNLHIDPALGKNIYVGYFQARDIYLNPNGGNVGIGTATPVNTLDVRGNSVSTGNFVNTSTFLNSVGVQGSCNNTPNYGYGIIGYGGQIGVLGQASLTGTGNRYGVFGIATGGTLAYGLYGTASGATTNFSGYFAGDVYCGGSYQGSDRKLKNDIKPLSDAMSIINQLKPSVYTFKTNEYKQMNLPEGLQYGLIADEVQQVVPGAVKKAVQPAEYENHDEKKGKKLSNEVEFSAVNYTEMIPILIGAVKEQQVIITSLQQQINELKKLVEKLVKQ